MIEQYKQIKENLAELKCRADWYCDEKAWDYDSCELENHDMVQNIENTVLNIMEEYENLKKDLDKKNKLLMNILNDFGIEVVEGTWNFK